MSSFNPELTRSQIFSQIPHVPMEGAHWTAQGVPDPIDADDDMSMGMLSSTASLRSSILRALEENGRKYHGYKDGKYVLPIDEQELERQESQYYLCLETFEKKLYFAPADRAHRVLDAGCGIDLLGGQNHWATCCILADVSQIFAILAEQHPHSEVIGVDLSPIQPTFMPPNAIFQIDDLEEDWNFSFKFDYIHTLMMAGAFRDWPRFLGQCHEFLERGGYVEVQDIDFPLRCDDGTMRPDSAVRRWSDLMMEAGERSGFKLDECGRVADMMRAAGFVDVVRVPFCWPVNRWPRDQRLKQLGLWAEENFAEGCEAMSMALFTRFMGWTKEEVVDFSARVRADLSDTSIHAYFPIYVTYGRKP
ncbi:uncharacterized protein PgNI_03956 [Pyricularia grisea]|uniref:Methyltransferase domain-containing protein n=1 Tax=Pyricularia grisea TaxID=148305 RepID=A0A6P8BFC7_PYRGI|nr:uncharacterized protein PgNI_03956 [Pyricularia grisea]TLD14424.1 hypothetical protein PgNI_03956 [Pyricularia grisea]